MRPALVAALVALLASCHPPDQHRPPPPDFAPVPGPAKPPPRPVGVEDPTPPPLSRLDFNRMAQRDNDPVFWVDDTNHDGKPQPDEVAPLLFFSTPAPSDDIDTLYVKLSRLAASPLPDPGIADGKRKDLVAKDLDQGRATLVLTDTTSYSDDDKKFADQMLVVATKIDALYEQMNGAATLAPTVPPDDRASQSLFRRNRGPRCVGPATENEPDCSAIPGAPRPTVDVYPAQIDPASTAVGLSSMPLKQDDPAFCKTIEASKDGKLVDPFTVVRQQNGKLVAVSYTVAYKDQMLGIAVELEAAAKLVTDGSEKPLKTYLTAAANGFRTNNWTPADEAWAKMSVDNSKWYVRAAPDEVYWEPCSHKASMHLTFARINTGSVAWQKKLTPIQQELEAAVAKKAGAPYKARSVSFHLPDFIDIVVNAGDDRNPLGATIGESLPNFGPVANEGRGRTVAMVNLYQDADSREFRRQQAASVLDAESMKLYAGGSDAGLLGTILHEATHNLGPSHEYKAPNVPPLAGTVASMMEELKAQTGALFLLDILVGKKLITNDDALHSYTDDIVWAFGHISQGMYTGAHVPKTYGHVAAIQIGYLIDAGALTWDPNKMAANGKDKGAFTIHPDKLATVSAEMMSAVAGIKARADAKGAKALIDRYVDVKAIVPHDVIAERFLRYPKASFVYSIRR